MTVRETMIRWSLALAAVVVVAFAAIGAEARNAVTNVRLGSHPDGVTRFVMDLSGNLNFTVSAHADPDRIVVAAPDVAWNAAAVRPFGSVSRVHYDDGAGRIVLELKDPAVVKSAFTIAPQDGQGWRFVMDLRQTTRAAFLAEAKPKALAQPKPQPAQAQPVPAKMAEAKSSLPQPVVLKEPEAPTQAAPPQRMVFYSPEVTPPPAPPPAAAPVPTAAPSSPVAAKIDPPPARLEPLAKAAKAAGSVIMSAPVPPPLERPLATPAVVTPATPTPAPVPAVAVTPSPAPAPVITKAALPLPAPEPDAKPHPVNGKPVIVIDPGHGGVDPGAIGVSGIYEKYITLAVARELKTQLEKGGRFTVHLTRDRDVFIRLRERVGIGRQHNADLFISLHADSVGNPQLKGLSVYTLSQNASDSEAQALADKENKADLIAGIDLSHESADVANILIDLAQRETMNRSAVFASGVVDEVGRETQLLGNTHRFAGFAVLKAPDVPSVLVELGYLSNEGEERSLRQPEYRAKLAKAMARSIERFFLHGQKAKRP